MSIEPSPVRLIWSALAAVALAFGVWRFVAWRSAPPPPPVVAIPDR